MKLKLAWVSLWAVLLLSAGACTRAPEPAEETHSVAEETQRVADDAHAAEDTPAESTPATPCDDAPDQRAMTACWSNASRTEEERVGAALKKVDELFASRTNAAAQQQLKDDQRRWQEFVEGHCGLYEQIYDGGSAAPMTVAVCRYDLAQARVEQLTQLTNELNQ